MRNVDRSLHAADSALVSSYVQAPEPRRSRSGRSLRGLIALGLLFVTTAAGYGVAFVLIDLAYKGGSLGIL